MHRESDSGQFVRRWPETSAFRAEFEGRIRRMSIRRPTVQLSVIHRTILRAATVVLWFSTVPVARAQMNTAEIRGVVMDASGAVIPGASVTAVQIGTQLKFTAMTNETGQYALEQLPLGDYSLTVSAPRFKEAVDPHVILHVGDHFREDFTLEVGKIDEVLLVEAATGRYRSNPRRSRT